MEYDIIQHSDDIEIFYKGSKFLFVKRRRNWAGTLNSKIYKGNDLILESDLRISFFKRIIELKHQSLEKVVSLSKINKRHVLIVDNHNVMIGSEVSMNSLFSIYGDSNLLGKVYPKSKGIELPPYTFSLVFQEASDLNFYGMLLLLMQFPTIYF
jgi:hypothetical protein